jgi:hypothetical protein
MTPRLEKLSGHAHSLLDAFLGLRLNYALLRPLLGDPDSPVVLLPRGHFQLGVPALRATLFYACVLDVAKLSWDDDSRSPSLVNLISALRDPAFLRILRDAHGNTVLTPREPGDADYEEALRRIDETRRESQIKHFDAVCDRVFEAWERFDSLPSKASFLTMRDKHVAHLEVRLQAGSYLPVDIGTLGMRRGDLGAAISGMEGLVRDITEVFRMSDFQMTAAGEMFDRGGESFWSQRQLP